MIQIDKNYPAIIRGLRTIQRLIEGDRRDALSLQQTIRLATHEQIATQADSRPYMDSLLRTLVRAMPIRFRRMPSRGVETRAETDVRILHAFESQRAPGPLARKRRTLALIDASIKATELRARDPVYMRT